MPDHVEIDSADELDVRRERRGLDLGGGRRQELLDQLVKLHRSQSRRRDRTSGPLWEGTVWLLLSQRRHPAVLAGAPPSWQPFPSRTTCRRHLAWPWARVCPRVFASSWGVGSNDMTSDDEATRIPAPTATTRTRLSGRREALNQRRGQSGCEQVMRIPSGYLNPRARILTLNPGLTIRNKKSGTSRI